MAKGEKVAFGVKYISSSKKKNCRNRIFIGEHSVSQDFSCRENRGTLKTERIKKKTCNRNQSSKKTIKITRLTD